MERECAHIHIGGGSLGLGLIAASSCSAGIPVHVLTMPGRVEPPAGANYFELEVRFGDAGESRIERHYVASFSLAATLGHLHPEVRRDLLECPHLLVTAALTTEGFEAAQPLILELLNERHLAGRARSTIFIACENDPGPTFDAFRASLHEIRVRCLPTMINRVCETYSDASGVRRVLVDEMQEWVVEIAVPPVPPTLIALDALEHFFLVPVAGAIALRKKVMINGAHLSLGILARLRNHQTIGIAVSAKDVDRWLAVLNYELARAVHLLNAGQGDDEQYGHDHFQSAVRVETPVKRILKRLRRCDMLPFFEDFDQKLGRAMRAQREHDGEICEVFLDVLDGLHELLEKLDNFEDASYIRDHTKWMSVAKDDAALKRYGEMLASISGDLGLSARRVESLSHTWTDHRELIERRRADRRYGHRRHLESTTFVRERRGGSDRRSAMDRRRPATDDDARSAA